jgi:drug/metabolite transporter (DMT)-like permease
VLLLFVSAAWGSAFPLMKDLIARMPVADLLTERYTIATLALMLVSPRCLRGLREGTWRTGVVAGLLFGAGQTAQAVALHALPSAVSGFAVGLYVVITPLLGLLVLRVRITLRMWLAVLLALAALVVFSVMRGAEGSQISVPALALTLMAAILYAVHTLVLGRCAKRRREIYGVAVIQLATIAVITGIMAVPGGLTLPAGPEDWGLLAHLALIACALGFLARSFGQRHVPPVPAAVLLAAQPLWVTAFAVFLYGDRLTWPVFLGGGLIATSILLVVLPRIRIPGVPRGGHTTRLRIEDIFDQPANPTRLPDPPP